MASSGSHSQDAAKNTVPGIRKEALSGCESMVTRRIFRVDGCQSVSVVGVFWGSRRQLSMLRARLGMSRFTTYALCLDVWGARFIRDMFRDMWGAIIGRDASACHQSGEVCACVRDFRKVEAIWVNW